MRKIFLYLILLISTTAMAQQLSTTNKKALKLYGTARTYYLNQDFANTEKYTRAAIKKDSMFIEAYYLLASSYDLRDMQEQNLSVWETCVRKTGHLQPIVYLYLANEQLSYGMYAEAEQNLKVLNAAINTFKDKDKKAIKSALEQSEYGKKQMANPVPFNPKNMGEAINTINDDYLPTLTVDESFVIVTSRIPREGDGAAVWGKDHEDFFVSFKENNKWTERKNIGKPINTLGNEGAQTMTADGRMFFFTACNRTDSYGSCDIYYSQKRGDKWSLPRNLGKNVNSRHWESQPTVSADGRELYFVSNRPGGYGESDIYKTSIDQYGEWKKPVNLGSVINTARAEVSPFIHVDGKTLYFASDGRLGMGGKDLYRAFVKDDGTWTEPKNLGYPINTYEDEGDLIVNGRGDKGYFASDREGGYGGLDLYEFDLYDGARPNLVTYVKGKIYDARTKKHLSALFELINVKTGKLAILSYSDPTNGEFLIPIPSGENYALNVTKQGYLFHSENFELSDSATAYEMSIPLYPIQKGEKAILRNVFFATDSFNLKPESIVELNRLVDFLVFNSTVKIEISGHTDNTGNSQSNIILSHNRAKAVYDYLIEKGISHNRLSYQGYGDTKPLKPNDSDENKAMNRRTEFTIVEK